MYGFCSNICCQQIDDFALEHLGYGVKSHLQLTWYPPQVFTNLMGAGGGILSGLKHRADNQSEASVNYFQCTPPVTIVGTPLTSFFQTIKHESVVRLHPESSLRLAAQRGKGAQEKGGDKQTSNSKRHTQSPLICYLNF